MKILADATLPHVTTLFQAPFVVTTYRTEDELFAKLPFHDILLCRSTVKLTQQKLLNMPIQCIATASSGVDHIDTEYLETKGIELIDAKGSNAHAVADYVMSTLAWLHQHESIQHKKAGIIGLGCVGQSVAAYLQALHLDTVYYDPPRAQREPLFQSCTQDELSSCDLLFIHANLHEKGPFPSKYLIDADFLARLKPNTTLINAARGGIVNEEALLNAQQPLTYCTDVYMHEPQLDSRVIDFAHLCTPHVAGHSIEAKSRAVEQIAHALHTHYNVPLPAPLVLPKPQRNEQADQETWDAYVLRLYNPAVETTALKHAINSRDVFLDLRRTHQHRHDFNAYTSAPFMQSLKVDAS